jgi:hypothetical protein
MFQQYFDPNFKHAHNKYVHGGEEWERRRYKRVVTIKLQQGNLVGLANTQQISLRTRKIILLSFVVCILHHSS